uniref:Glycoside hydrolase family 42 N-terminal domain-containing protein n=1 Tax=Fundidesulfovibrio putealis TaxID=270496 RepID=A0A7C4ENR9_9BACT
MFLWHLERGWAFYSKRVLWEMLRQRYKGDFAALLKDFVPAPGFDSFEKLKEAGAALKLRPGGQGIKAVNQFTYLIARRYYELVFRAMRKAAPGALVVGDRLPLYYCQDAVLAQRGLVDVLSTNYNVDAPDGWVAPYYFEGLRDLIAAPILISEYFFAADDNRSGNVNNGHLMHVATQPERARGATAALRNFAGFPNVAGVHWFQFADEPTGGRSDGEDFNMGLVDIHDQPYELLTQAFAELTPRIPDIHAASRWEPKPDPALAPVLPRAGAAKSVTDGSILDWPDKRVSRLRGFATPKPYAPFGDVHLAWDQRGLYFMNIAGNYVDLSLLDWQGEFPLSETYQIHITADAGAGPRHFAVHLAPRPHSVWPGRFELAPQLWEYQGGRPVRQLEAKGLVQALDKPLPHIQVEGLIPATELGVPALTPGQRVALSVSVTNFYGELTMTWASRDAVLGQATDNAGATQ